MGTHQQLQMGSGSTKEQETVSRPQVQHSMDDDLARIMAQYDADMDAIHNPKKENPRWRIGAKNPCEADCRAELKKFRNGPTFDQLKDMGIVKDRSYDEVWAIALKTLSKEKDLKKKEKCRQAFGKAIMK